METKEKADTAYAIAEVTQEEWNRIQGLKPARPTRILEVRKLEDTIYTFIVPLSYGASETRWNGNASRTPRTAASGTT